MEYMSTSQDAHIECMSTAAEMTVMMVVLETDGYGSTAAAMTGLWQPARKSGQEI